MRATLVGMMILTAASTGDPESPAKHVRRSVHDLTGTGGRSACKACHLPHDQAGGPTSRPAKASARQSDRDAHPRDVSATDRPTPGPTSLICLGCHDGTVATSTIGASHALSAGSGGGFAVPDRLAWRDHPIGVPYPSDRRQYRPKAFVLRQGKVRLPQGRVECISCHDPHGKTGVPGLLVMSNRRSALCLTCHVK